MFLGAVEVERRQKLAVGHCLEMVGVAANSDELLDVGVPRRDIVVGDRPVHPVAELLRRDELVLAPALARTAPDDRLAADLVAADPVERFGLHVGVIAVLDEEVHGVFAVARGLADERIFLDDLARKRAALRKLPRIEIHRGVVLDVDYVAPALEDEGLESLLAQLLRRPATGDSRSDNDGVEG